MNVITNLLKNVWFRGFVISLFEKVPFLSKVFKLIDGKKTLIGRILMAVAAILAAVSEFFPEYFQAGSVLAQVQVGFVAVVGWVMTELGLQHKTAKELSEEGVVKSSEV